MTIEPNLQLQDAPIIWDGVWRLLRIVWMMFMTIFHLELCLFWPRLSFSFAMKRHSGTCTWSWWCNHRRSRTRTRGTRNKRCRRLSSETLAMGWLQRLRYTRMHKLRAVKDFLKVDLRSRQLYMILNLEVTSHERWPLARATEVLGVARVIWNDGRISLIGLRQPFPSITRLAHFTLPPLILWLPIFLYITASDYEALATINFKRS